MTSAELRRQIVDAINKILADSARSPRDLSDEESLTADVGLDSLDLAVLVVSLEQQLGVDPFRDGSATVRTVGDLVTVYAKAEGS